MNVSRSLLVTCTLIICTVGSRSVTAQPTPEAQKIMLQASQFAKSVKTAYGDIMTTVVTAQGPSAFRTQLWAEMPDKILTRNESQGNVVAQYQVGNQATIYIQKNNKYSIRQRPNADVQGELYEQLVGGLEGVGPLADRTGNRQVTFVGKETVAGIPTNHLKVTIPGGASGDLWLSDGPKPLPVYIRFSTVEPRLNGEAFCRWVVDRPLPAGIFQFTPPPGATSMSGATSGQ